MRAPPLTEISPGALCSLIVAWVLLKFIRSLRRAEESTRLPSIYCKFCAAKLTSFTSTMKSFANLKCEMSSLNINVVSCPAQRPKHILQCVTKQFQENYVPLSYASSQWDMFSSPVLSLDGDGHCRVCCINPSWMYCQLAWHNGKGCKTDQVSIDSKV